MASEEYWEQMVRKFMEAEELLESEDLSEPEPYTEDELEELYRLYNG